jgi:glycosyltransferase involved in cell wall biosynthesis
VHIGMIYGEYREFPPDIRVEKEVKVLAKARHRVTILVRQIPSNFPLEEELIPGHVFVRRIPLPGMSLLVKIWTTFSLIESAWFPHLERFIQDGRPDILHVHDFTMVPTVIKVAKIYDIPIVADLHENMPAALVAYRSKNPPLEKFIKAILLNYRLWRWHEARNLIKCARVIVVVPEAAERLKYYGIQENKIVVVSNTEDETTFRFDFKEADPEIMDKYKESWMISYVGGIGAHRGLDTVLKAISYVCSQIPGLKLTIVGAKGKYLDIIIKEVNRLGIGDSVEIIGWQPFKKVNSYILASKVCLVPHNDFEHTQTTVPHKLFQYMICARPVLVSNCRPLKRIAEETQSGCVFKANDSQDLGRQLVYMYNHPEELVQMGLNGQRAALGKYAWRHDAQRLVEMYDELK